MDPSKAVRLPQLLESAIQRVRMAARAAAERTVDSLGLAALASSNVFQRDILLGAQLELNRKLAIFALTFNDALDRRIARDFGQAEDRSIGGAVSSWDALSLVDDHEVEIQVAADRFALEISHACEWEIREVEAYLVTLLRQVQADPERSPLRAEVVGQAMIRAVESVADRPELRKVLATEIGRSLAQTMRETYVDIVNDLRNAGVQPIGLEVRQRHGEPGRSSAPGSLGAHSPDDRGQGGAGATVHGLTESGRLTPRGTSAGSMSEHGELGPASAGHGATLGRVDAQMMSLIRRLSSSTQALHELGDTGHGGLWADRAGGVESTPGLGRLMAPNLIVAHREELRQATTGAIDHMVIDVVAGLFDQILSDPKVPPQMARQIARLQLPVLRAALGDTSFFSSRRHPVRRFINRIASLGSAVDDFEGAEGQALLSRVRSLVQEIVEGDFDQIGTYEHKLNALEAFIAEQARAQVEAGGAADRVLARKEEQLRIQQRFAQQLETVVQGLPVPDFLRQFLGQTWSLAIASAELGSGADSSLARRARDVGRELVMSVQPKRQPALRSAFLRQLPQLMKDLNAGLDRIHFGESQRQAFFAKLLPAHAESLNSQALTTLDHNLLIKQVDSAMATPLPKAAELPKLMAGAPAVLNDVGLSATPFSSEEAQVVGLVDEASVDWNGQVDIDLSAEPEITAVDINIDGLPAPEPVEPMRGKSLADHVQIGFAYQMHVEGAWQKVRLAHVSAARSFFVFTHGAKQRKTISMTLRMLTRMCETGRMRAFENAYLIERATARARRQLAELRPSR